MCMPVVRFGQFDHAEVWSLRFFEIDFLMQIVCEDNGCTNMQKEPTPEGVGSFLHIHS